MRFDVITLFPELFAPFLRLGVTRRAYESGQVDVRLWSLRDFGEGPHQRVDDRPFGGGPGMVMMADPLARCLNAIRSERQDSAPVVLFSPLGRRLDHEGVQSWSDGKGAVLVCGRYEGVDQRFVDACVDMQISLGDFVLSGGEIPAMALLDSVARLQPGVLHDAGSHAQDSFNPDISGLLDCPHYTRPEVWIGPQGPMPTPTELLSGHHAHIQDYRFRQRLAVTARWRPDLLRAAESRGLLSGQVTQDAKGLVAEAAARGYNKKLSDPLSSRPFQSPD